jgi:putative transposase
LEELLLQFPDLYRAIRNGDTVEFWFSERRNLTAAKRFLRKALKPWPTRAIVIDGSHTHRVAILACEMTDRFRDGSRRKKSIRIRQSRYLNNRIEQDYRAIKRRMRPRFGFQTVGSARAIQMIHMMRKQQAKYARNQRLSLADQFERLAA